MTGMLAQKYPMAYAVEPGRIEFREHVLPELGPLDVRLRVRAVCLCGSDLHIFRGRHPAAALPVPVGHEAAGDVLEVGPAVTRLKPGDRVAVEPVMVCGECQACRSGNYHLCEQISFQYRRGQGAITPILTVPERWLHLLPAALSWGEGALLEPLAVAVHAVRRSAFQPGDHVAIFGAGAIGLLVLQVLRAWGAGPVYAVDIQPDRLAMAEALGAALAFDNRQGDAVAAIRVQTGGPGVERAFEAAGLQVTLVQALHALRKGGTAVLVGLFEDPQPALPVNLFVQKEISLLGTQAYHWDFQRAAALAGAGRVQLERMITHRFPLEQAQQAFEALANPHSGAVKVMIGMED